jgi:hypothetical protein
MLALLIPLGVIAKEHYARMEPYERVTLKAAVSGRIVSADRSNEGKLIVDGEIIHIDDMLDAADLNSTVSSRKLIASTLELTRRMLPGLKGTYLKKADYFKRVDAMLTASKTQKDNAYAAMVSAENQYLSTREKALNLEKQLLDIDYKIKMLTDRIEKKHIRLKNRYLYKLIVRAGEYVAPGSPLAIVDDIGRARLVIFLDRDEIGGIEKKSIWLNGKKSDLKFFRIWKESDEKYISSYRAEIVLDPVFPFSSLVKVEVK